MKSGLLRHVAKKSKSAQIAGFTIMETMIFLAVSGALLLIAFNLIGGSQNKTQFQEATVDLQERITAVINNVANGYYPRSDDVTCVIDASSKELKITSGGNARGTNKDCIFVGRAIKFDQDSDEFKVYDIAGARKATGSISKEVTSMSDARPKAMDNPEIIQLKFGARVEKVQNMSSGKDVGAVGFFTGFGNYNSDDQLLSGSLQTDFASLNVLLSGADTMPFYFSKTGYFRTEYSSTPSSIKNPAKGIQICLRSATTNQHAIITIGGENRSASLSRIIEDGPC